MIKTSNKLHLLGFSLVLLSLLSLASYQLFVTPKFTRVPINQFLKLSTLKKLFYQSPDLGQPQNFPNPNPLTVVCQPDCHFVLKEQTIKAQLDNDQAASLSELSLGFFDPNPGLIGYQHLDPNNPTFFVLDLDGNLLQVIRLNLNQFRLMEFINYYPQTHEILFKSTHQQTQKTEHWLYKADQPSLRQIDL